MAGIAAWQGETPRKVRHPSVGIRRQLPFQGSLWGKQPLAKPPLQGEVSPKVTEGCIAAQPYRYPLQDARKARRGCPARRRTPVRADGGHRRLARGNAPQGAAPLSRHLPTAPLPGEPLGEAAVRKASPARGGVTEGDGGVHCRAALPVSFAGCPQGPPWLPRKALRPGSFAGNAPIRGQGPHLNFSFLISNSRKTAVPGPRRKARPGRFVISRPTPHPQATGGTHHAATLAGPRKQSGRQPRQRL